jgi:hypothetical protein
MCRLLQVALVLAVPLGVAASSAITRAAAPARQPVSTGGPAGSVLSAPNSGSPTDESSVLQNGLQASNEEWSIIYPKLLQIIALRDAVQADGPTAALAGTGLTRRMFNGPMGGTSMDAPNMAGRGRWGNRPFDPAKAPGSAARASASSGLGAALTRGLARNWANAVKTGQGNSVQILLAELQTLLGDTSTSDKQLFDKLTAIRSARAKAARELDAAQQDLKLLLTTDQLAVLVSLGYMD